MLSLTQFVLLLQLPVIHLKLDHALRFNFPLPSDIAPDETTITSFFASNSQIISLTTFLRTALFTPPLLFVRRRA